MQRSLLRRVTVAEVILLVFAALFCLFVLWIVVLVIQELR